MNVFRCFFSGISLASLAAMPIGCSDRPSPQGATATPSQEESTPPPPAASAPPIEFLSLTATDLAKAFAEDAAGAYAKYEGKFAFVDGVVARNEQDANLGSQLILDGYKGETETINIRCWLATADPPTVEEFERLKAGDKVRVRAICGWLSLETTVEKVEGAGSFISLTSCAIVSGKSDNEQ